MIFLRAFILYEIADRKYGSSVLVFGEGNGTPLQYSCLENPMDGRIWRAAVHGVMKSRTQLSDFTFTFHFHALEKEMATHSGVLAWRVPGMGEPGGLLSLGSHRVGHDLSDLAKYIPRIRIARSYIQQLFNFLRNCQTAFQGSCTTFHSQ